MSIAKTVKLIDLLNEYPNNIEVIKMKYLELLSELTIISDLDTHIFSKNIESIHQMGYIIIKYTSTPECDDFEIIASGTIIIEPKIIRGGKSVGHIEDIVVKYAYRGKQMVKEILQQLQCIAREKNCYKIILDCSEHVKKVYEKYGFQENAVQMAVYL
jgi:glucosamine-phosphate N-acetyltransferase